MGNFDFEFKKNENEKLREKASMIKEIDASMLESNTPGEDRFAFQLSPQVSVFLVVDGHGGYLAADIAMRCLPHELFKRVSSFKRRNPKRVVQAIEKAFEAVDDVILTEAKKLQLAIDAKKRTEEKVLSNVSVKGISVPGKAGCCVVAVIVADGYLYVAHVGDCKAVVFSQIKDDEVSDILSEMGPTGLEVIASEQIAPVDESSRDTVMLSEYAQESAEKSSKKRRRKTAEKPSKSCLRTVDKYLELCTIERERSSPITELTMDHCCQNPTETSHIALKSSDPNPIRPSPADVARFGSTAGKRVAGSLAVTRALGDGYLKIKELSVPPFSAHLPYITSRPTVSYRPLLPSDRLLILASDGLWNFVTPRECLNVIEYAVEVENPGNRGHDETRSKRKSNHLENLLGGPEDVFVSSHIPTGSSSRDSLSSTTSSTATLLVSDYDIDAESKVQGAPVSPRIEYGLTINRECLYEELGRFSFQWENPTIGRLPEPTKSPDITMVSPLSVKKRADPGSDLRSLSERLLYKCVETSAAAAGLKPKQLWNSKLPSNMKKREIIDDVTIMVVNLR